MRFDLHAPDTCVRQPASARRQRPALAAAAALSLLACLPAATFAEDGDATRDFLKCMELKDPEARLACYDRLAVTVVELGLGRSGDGSAATGAAGAAAAPGESPVEAPGVATRAAPATPEEEFGLEQRAKSGVDSIVAGVVGGFQGWSGQTTFQLDNGQVWVQVGSERFNYSGEDRRVEIRRGILGSFSLSPKGLNRTVRVRRVE